MGLFSVKTRKQYRLTDLELTRVDRVAAGSNPESHVVLFKSASDYMTDDAPILPDSSSKETSVPDKDTQPDEVEKDAPVADEPQADAASPEQASTDQRSEDTIAKAERDEIAKELKEAKDEIAKMRAEQTQREFRDIAKSELPKLPGKSDEVGDILMKAHDALDEDEYKSLFKMLKAANAQADTAEIFKELGNPDNDDASKSVAEIVAEKAQALVDSGDAKTLEIAKAKVMKDSPELRKQYADQRN